MTIGDLIKFNEFLDSTIEPENLDEEFITLRQTELQGISKNSDIKHLPLIALSYAKLMELTVFLAGRYADNCQIPEFGDLMVNPRHTDVCILNTRLIKEDYGIIDGIPLWFKKQVNEYAGCQYSEDLGRMVVAPSLLFHFAEKDFLLKIVKKERHKRLSDQFRNFMQFDVQSAFPSYAEDRPHANHILHKELGCGGVGPEGLDVAAWLSRSTVLNIVKDTLRNDLMNLLCRVMSDDYLKSVKKKFERAQNSLDYVNMGRKKFANFPYDKDIPITEWADINCALCHFTLDGYVMVQSELERSFSDPFYKSPFLNRFQPQPENKTRIVKISQNCRPQVA